MNKLELIKRNTAEIVKESELKELLKKKKTPSTYIGMACTGKVHIGYFITISKIKDFLKAGFKFTILIADLHAHLDDRKAPFDLLEKRAKYYKEVFTAMLKSINAPTKNLKFVKGSDFQLKKEYTLDMFKLSALNTLTRCKRAAAEVVRFGNEPKLSGFIYPIMQALDEQYLNVDCQYGGIDQRKILMFARENLPKLGYKPRIEIMTPMLPGLKGEKMSASVKESKIDILASKAEIKSKISKAYCPAGIIENNGILAFFKQVIMPLKEDNKKKLIIKRPEKFGGSLSYSNYNKLEKDFVSKKLHPADLKSSLIEELDKLISPIRKKLKGKDKLIEQAYPKEN